MRPRGASSPLQRALLCSALRVGAPLVFAASGGACGEAEPSPPDTRLLTEVESPPGFSTQTVAAAAPADNALTEERAQLGKRLFFDTRLSRTGEVSCGSCHVQEHAFADPRAVSTGVEGRMGRRNAPALVNLAFADSLFWDGRVRTLEEQAGKPIEDRLEMDLPLAEAAGRLAAAPSYTSAFERAYGGPPTPESLRKALASFVRTLVSANSRYDRHLRGEANALDERESRGLALFLGERARCFHCHPAKTLTNDGFFNNGTFDGGADTGREALTGRTGDLGAFRVPGLRNVAVTAPYMHDGSVATLEEVVEQYDRGGRGHPSTDVQIEPLHLAADEKADLIAFLRALTDAAFLTDPRYRAPARSPDEPNRRE